MLSNYGDKVKATGGDIPPCLCKQVMHHIATMPKLKYSALQGKFLMYCPACGLKTHPDWCKNAVIAEWCGVNKPGDMHIQDLWIKRYTEQQKESLATKEISFI